MTLKITFAESAEPNGKALVLPIFEGAKMPKHVQAIDKKVNGVITKLMELRKFTGKNGQSLVLPFPQGVNAEQIILIGFGEKSKITANSAQKFGGTVYAASDSAKCKEVMVDMGSEFTDAIVANVALGARLRSYRFDQYKTKLEDDKKPQLKKVVIAGVNEKKAEGEFKAIEGVAESVFLTRNLVSEPANVIYPETLANEAKRLSKLGVEIEVLNTKDMKTLGMGALLGAAQGSENEPKLVSMRWNGGKKGEKPIAFVGKGVTFDTGGISIKPAAGMEEMKWDMAGSATVIGLMHAIASRKLDKNVVGVVALVENMPSGNAQRPGDVVVSMSGQTIEVINTDAEGRLILADALWYAQDKFEPHTVIDLATLTGAVIIALGSHKAGLFANDEKLAELLLKSGENVGEDLWRLPLGDVYDKQINSDIADMRNVGEGREAGSTAGAIFLQRFIKDGVKWAHLDIAGTAWSKKDSDIRPKGATAFGLRLLNHFIDEYKG